MSSPDAPHTHEVRPALASLVQHVTVFEAALLAADDEQGDAEAAARGLQRSVLRPLRTALERPPGSKDGHSPRTPDDDRHATGATEPVTGANPEAERLWDLASEATQLRLSPGVPSEVQEATAALQDLACRYGSEGADRLAELRALQAELPCGIQTQPGGPYLVTNAETLRNWLGEALATRPQMALCRCGASQAKPFCDGTHAEIGFEDGKDPGRVADRRDTYVGQQVAVLDNRGTCQHAGLCTDRLATVFRLDCEPFVAPSGGRMDEIIRAVRDCPSGALSYAIDGREARQQVDHHGTREPGIEVTRDGPYRITGAIPLTDGDGEPAVRNDGASHEHYALCRCGRSQNKPFCSGMHWSVDFKDPATAEEPTMFQWAGGMPALTRMTRLFYEKHVPGDPLLAPLFANMADDHPERVAMWLGEVFGGPTVYSDRCGEHVSGYARMVSEHIGKGLTEAKRTRWVQLLLTSAREAGLPNDAEFRAAFQSYIEWGSRLAVENSQSGAKPPEHMPMPRWDWTTAAGPPGSRPSALEPAAAEEAPVVLPGPDEEVGFEQHIKALFRSRDRQSMRFAFDLWAYDDVKQHGEAILERLRDGSMPCDGAWPQERIDAFDRWVTTGMRE